MLCGDLVRLKVAVIQQQAALLSRQIAADTFQRQRSPQMSSIVRRLTHRTEDLHTSGYRLCSFCLAVALALLPSPNSVRANGTATDSPMPPQSAENGNRATLEESPVYYVRDKDGRLV